MQLFYNNILHPIVPYELISSFSTLDHAVPPIPARRTLSQSAESAWAPIATNPTQTYYVPRDFRPHYSDSLPRVPTMRTSRSTPIADGWQAWVGQDFTLPGLTSQLMTPPPEPPTEAPIEIDRFVCPSLGQGHIKGSKAGQGMSPYQREYEKRKDHRSESGDNTTSKKIKRNLGKRVASKTYRFGQANSANAVASSSINAVEHEEYAHIVRTPDAPNEYEQGIHTPKDADDGPSTSSSPQTSSHESCTYRFPQPPVPEQTTAGLLQKRGTLGALVLHIQVPRHNFMEKPTKEAPPGRRGAIIGDIRGPPSAAVRARAREVAQNKANRMAMTQLRKDQEKALRMVELPVR